MAHHSPDLPVLKTSEKAICTELATKNLHLPSHWETDYLRGTGGTRLMLSKCANPSCSTPLVYLREGKIFMMVAPSRLEVATPTQQLPKETSRIEHYWLCGRCSAEMTLAYDRQRGVQIVPKKFDVLRATAS